MRTEVSARKMFPAEQVLETLSRRNYCLKCASLNVYRCATAQKWNDAGRFWPIFELFLFLMRHEPVDEPDGDAPTKDWLQHGGLQ